MNYRLPCWWQLIILLGICSASAQTADGVETQTNSVSPALVTSAPPANLPDVASVSSLIIQPGTVATNVSGLANTTTNAEWKAFGDQLAKARYLATTRQFTLAEPELVKLLASNVPDEIQRSALFELGGVVRGENDLARAQTIYGQFLQRWSDDIRVPEVLLRQGQVFRQMGLGDLALAKFYSVMTAALSLKQSQLEYYRQLVLQAQVEIAETQFQSGKYADAAEYYSRLLENTGSALNYSRVHFLLIRALIAAKQYDRAAGRAQDFLARYQDNPCEPEVRYYLAEALKAQGRNGDALQQVLLFLKQEKSKAGQQPEAWAYWQRRVGNEIANQLYQDGDYVRALEVYRNLDQLDSSADWQLPVEYQIGLTYERLLQPEKAADIYTKIIEREAGLGTNVVPALSTVLDMARWRVGFIGWQKKAETINQPLALGSSTNTPTNH